MKSPSCIQANPLSALDDVNTGENGAVSDPKLNVMYSIAAPLSALPTMMSVLVSGVAAAVVANPNSAIASTTNARVPQTICLITIENAQTVPQGPVGEG